MKIQTENIFQVIELKANPTDIYKIFLDESDHTAFTGMKAEINPTVGGAFNACNGRTVGTILELVKNKRIVVAWQHKKFPKHHFSIVDIDIEKSEIGCRIKFNHIGVPSSCDGWLTDNWMKTYWQPLREYVGNTVTAS